MAFKSIPALVILLLEVLIGFSYPDYLDLESNLLWFCTFPKVAPTEGDFGRLEKEEVWFKLLLVVLKEFSFA